MDDKELNDCDNQIITQRCISKNYITAASFANVVKSKSKFSIDESSKSGRREFHNYVSRVCRMEVQAGLLENRESIQKLKSYTSIW